MANQLKLTKEQLQHVKTLPVRTVITGGAAQKIACDFEGKAAYFLNEDGLPTGRAVHLSDEKISKLQKAGDANTQAQPTKPDNESRTSKTPNQPKTQLSKKQKAWIFLRKLAGASDQEIGNKLPKEDKPAPTEEPPDTLEGTSDSDQKPAAKKKTFLIPVVIIAAIAIIAAIPKFTETPSKETTELQTKSLDTINVIQVTEDLIPGDVISENNIQQVSISAETYNQISLSSVSLYQWSRSQSLIDAYAVRYIPQGQYLTYDNVNTVYHQPNNPWGKESAGTAFIIVPLTEELINSRSVNYGSILDLTIIKKTVQTTGGKSDEDEESSEIAGLEHKTSVTESAIVDTYGLSNIIVCDLLNADKKSLYKTYTSWMEIPAGEQIPYIKNQLKTDDKLAGSLIPKFVQVKVTTEQANALGSLLDEDVVVDIIVQKEKEDTNTDAKSLYSAEAKALLETIDTLSEEIKSEAKNDESEDYDRESE